MITFADDFRFNGLKGHPTGNFCAYSIADEHPELVVGIRPCMDVVYYVHDETDGNIICLLMAT